MVAVSDAYEDPAFGEALETTPNKHSDKALALLISYKCFHEDCGMSTCEGLSAAFKKLWEEAQVHSLETSCQHLVLTFLMLPFHLQGWRHLPWQVAFQ